MKKSIIQKIEILLSAMLNGTTGQELKEIIHQPLRKATLRSKTEIPPFRFKLLQLIQ